MTFAVYILSCHLLQHALIPTCFSIGQFVAWRPWGVVGWIVRCPLLLQRFLFDLDLDLWLDRGAVEFCAHFIGRLWQHFCGWRGRPSSRCAAYHSPVSCFKPSSLCPWKFTPKQRYVWVCIWTILFLVPSRWNLSCDSA